MTQEDKQLLLKDLCARLPYGVICNANGINLDGELLFINKVYNLVALYNDKAVGKFDTCPIADVKPYLRPMSSMTEEEKSIMDSLWKENNKLVFADPDSIRRYRFYDISVVDFLNKRHFDYRGLIEKGLAIEVTKENEPYK